MISNLTLSHSLGLWYLSRQKNSFYKHTTSFWYLYKSTMPWIVLALGKISYASQEPDLRYLTQTDFKTLSLLEWDLVWVTFAIPNLRNTGNAHHFSSVNLSWIKMLTWISRTNQIKTYHISRLYWFCIYFFILIITLCLLTTFIDLNRFVYNTEIFENIKDLYHFIQKPDI